VREIVGFVMGAAAGAAGALFATSPEGRALLERLKDEARPEVDRAATEWEPVLREVGRAVRLAVRELETATTDLRARIGEIAADQPDEVARALAEPEPATASEASEAPEVALAGEAPELARAPLDPPSPSADGAGEPASTT
jgi:hypothetical protein